MRFQYLLPLAAFSSALVLPDEQVFNELSIQSHHKAESVLDQLHSTKDKAIKFLQGSFQHEELKTVGQLFDDAVAEFDSDNEFLVSSLDDQSVAAQAFLKYSTEEDFEVADEEDRDHPPPPPPPPHHGPDDKPPHHGPPGDEPPHHGPPKDGPPHHGPPRGKPPHHGPPGHGKRPHHPPHHKPNETIYELISKSKYTTKLAELINKYDDVVKLLNSTKANYTIFAPTDYAFSKIPEHGSKPPKEFIERLLIYHVAPGLFPAGRVLYDKTVPTMLLEKECLGGPQRITARVGLKGVTLNLYSRIVAVNIPATNGIIHGIDSILIPPPKALTILNAVPTEFSTLLYALEKTGLHNSTSLSTTGHHTGGTLFAPSNNAFRKLGPRVNGFLFSPVGTKYLRALLLYHVVVNQTVYSTAYYNGTDSETSSFSNSLQRKGCHHKNAKAATYPYVHFDLPTLLEGRSLAVDIGRYGPFVEIKINAFNRVGLADVAAKDGVIHLPERVLIPPKQLSGPSALSYWTGEEMTVEEFKDRLEPFLEDGEFSIQANLEL